MNPSHRIFAAHELAVIDPAMGTKMTVQFNLFGGTVLRLGTERHHYLLEGIDRMTDVGCFGLTELGYGNNAVEMETTATYDKAWLLRSYLTYFLNSTRFLTSLTSQALLLMTATKLLLKSNLSNPPTRTRTRSS